MIEINNGTRSRINTKLVNVVVSDFLKYYKLKNKEVSIAFVGDVAMRRLNCECRGKDRVTDVLSFEDEGDFFGEIIIDYAQIKRQSKKFSNSVKKELIYILVHGLLHLMGYEDESGEGSLEMKVLGEKFIKKMNY